MSRGLAATELGTEIKPDCIGSTIRIGLAKVTQVALALLSNGRITKRVLVLFSIPSEPGNASVVEQAHEDDT